MRLIIFAINVHQGGGAALLNPLLSAIEQSDISCIAFLDTRLKLPAPSSSKIHIYRVFPSVFNRLSAEATLKKTINSTDVVLSFGNLPPLLKLGAKTILFLQNRYLIDKVSLRSFNLKTRLRLIVERIWLILFCKNADTIIVQTPSMQSCVSKLLGRDAVIVPFIDKAITYNRTVSISNDDGEKKYDFIYVASGEPHKNHKNLVESWVILATEGIFPVLCLTLNMENCEELFNWVSETARKYDLKIENLGFVHQAVVMELYSKSKAMIYPSTLESFGLPLIEARNANLPIIASELDYVRDIIDPEETFDPASPRSIARAVKRFLGYVEKDLPLFDPTAFLKYCLNDKDKALGSGK